VQAQRPVYTSDFLLRFSHFEDVNERIDGECAECVVHHLNIRSMEKIALEIAGKSLVLTGIKTL
jgi:hypothetical protein